MEKKMWGKRSKVGGGNLREEKAAWKRRSVERRWQADKFPLESVGKIQPV
jgi:hypothetical protein